MIDFSTDTWDFSAQDEVTIQLKAGTNEFTLLNMLKNNKHITKLSFCFCGLTDDDLKVLMNLVKKYPHITSLNLSNNQLTDKGLIHLSKTLPHTELTDLDLSGNDTVTFKGLNELTQQLHKTKIRSLGLACMQLRSFRAQLLHNLQTSKVEILDFSTNAVERGEKTPITLGEALSHGPTLKQLNLAFSALNTEEVLDITSRLQTLSLQELDISGNQIEMNELPTILRHAKGSRLQKLHLHNCVSYYPKNFMEELNLILSNNLHFSYYQSGNALHYLTFVLNKFLPKELIEIIAKHCSPVESHSKAFIKGWEARKRLCQRKFPTLQQSALDETPTSKSYKGPGS